jgi:hypothetical protein
MKVGGKELVFEESPELPWDGANTENQTSEFFTLADGHRYFLHRIVRAEGKPPIYALLGGDADSATALTPYVSETHMEQVLRVRGGKPGFGPIVCPGCGAEITEKGAHKAKKEGEKEGEGEAFKLVECPDCDGKGTKLDRKDTITGEPNGSCKYCGGSGFIAEDAEDVEAARDEEKATEDARSVRKSRFRR